MQKEFYRFYREDTGQVLGITSKFNENQIKDICKAINNCELSAGKLLYQKASEIDFVNYQENLCNFSKPSNS